jgi:hypothetical protein
VLVLVPFVLLAVLVAALVWLLLRADDRNARDEAGDSALAVARQEAVNLTTLDYRTADRDLDRILALSTGGLRERFASERAKFPSVLRQERSKSEGSALSAGLVRLSPDLDAAQVVVAADASVSTGDDESTATTKHYRMVMRLARVDGKWLVDDVAFAGVPQ